MFNYGTNYVTEVPDISIYINCDTIIAVNLQLLNLDEFDEFIFTLKNYDYIDAPHIFTFRARKADADNKGEVVFKIPQRTSRHLKPGAFYTMTVLANAFDTKNETIYTSLTEKGNINLIYGMQDLVLKPDEDILSDYDIISMRLEPMNESVSLDTTAPVAEIVGLRIEPI